MVAALTICAKTDFEGLSVLHRWENDFRSGVRPFLSEFMSHTPIMKLGRHFLSMNHHVAWGIVFWYSKVHLFAAGTSSEKNTHVPAHTTKPVLKT